MKIKKLILATFLNISTPIIFLNITNNYSINAQTEFIPIGVFSNGSLSVSLWHENDTYNYLGYDESTQNSIQLSTPILDSNNNFFVWHIDDHQYQVAWQPQYPNSIKVTIINPNNQIITNTVLTRENVYY